MTYNKEERAEEMEIERQEDIKETSNEIDDGSMDIWIGENKEDLLAEFLDELNPEWINFCRERWNEINQ